MPKKAEIVNGWYISFRAGKWQAVRNGVVGFRDEDYATVYQWARYN